MIIQGSQFQKYHKQKNPWGQEDGQAFIRGSLAKSAVPICRWWPWASTWRWRMGWCPFYQRGRAERRVRGAAEQWDVLAERWALKPHCEILRPCLSPPPPPSPPSLLRPLGRSARVSPGEQLRLRWLRPGFLEERVKKNKHRWLWISEHNNYVSDPVDNCWISNAGFQLWPF